MDAIKPAVQEVYDYLEAEYNESGCLIAKRGWFTDRKYHMHRPKGAKKMVRTHRHIFQLQHGAADRNEYVCHSCDNPSCINLDHLWLGSQKDNMRDMIRKGRKVAVKGSKHGHAKITKKHVIAIRALDGLVSQTAIGELFGLSQGQIGRIIRREKWKHI